MKNNVFVLPLIAGLSIRSCIKNDLQPKGSYLDNRFFISKPYMFAVDANRGESTGFKCTDDGFVIIRFWLGNFIQGNGWKLQMSAIFYGDKGSKSFFCEVDDIGSEYYKATYTDEYYGLFEYSYDGPIIRGFENQIPFSFFQDTYHSAYLIMTIMNCDETYATLYSFGSVSALKWGRDEMISVMDFGNITKYGN